MRPHLPPCTLLLLALLLPLEAAAQESFGRGMILDDASYEAVPLMAPLMRSSFESLPLATSLKSYAPVPGNQGKTGTCVAWATAYGARTIIQAIQNGWTDTEVITASAFSPSYVYNQLRNQYGSDPTCTRGAYIPHALEIIRERGAADLSQFPFDCGRGVSVRDHEQAGPNRILEYTRLFGQGSKDKVLPIKKSLSEGKPVVIGMLVPTSFLNEHDDLWEPYPDDEVTPYDGHAMTIVSYDDNKYGGAFELMNSWGTRWGNEGFVWVKYDDFAEYVKYGFDVYAAQELPKDAPPLAGALTLKLLSGQDMKASRTGTVYRMDEVYPSQTEFEAFLTNTQPAYVYAFASDLSRQVTPLVPVDSTVSPFLPHAGSDVSLSGDFAFYLDDRPGIDYLTVLYSTEPLDLKTIISGVEQGEGTYEARVLAALGDRAIAESQIEFEADRIAFTAEFASVAGAGSVVPITVEIEHIGTDTDTDTHPPVITALDPAPAEDGQTILLKPGTETADLLLSAHDENGIAFVRLGERPLELGADGTLRVPVVLDGDSAQVVVTAADPAGNRTTVTYRFERQALDREPPLVAVVEPSVVKGKLRGIGVRKRHRIQRVSGTVTDPAGVSGLYVNGLAATLNGSRFEAEVPMAADEAVLTIRALDGLGNEVTADYQILDDTTSAESVRQNQAYVPGDEEYVTVNVYYGTDRARSGATDPGTFYAGQRGNLEYGRAAVSIPKGHSMGELESPVWWRFEFREDPSRHVMLQEVLPLDRGTALDEMRLLVERSSARSAFVFVHGYNVTFEDAARRTGQLAYDLDFQGAPIFYSWPSDGSLGAYTRDEADVEWSWPHLYEFLSDVSSASGADRIHVIGHSMGNRALTKALAEFARRDAGRIFDQVLLAAPDIDAQTFAEQIAPVIPSTASRVTLYASSRDRALQASQAVHGYARAGDSGEGLVVIDGIDTVDASTVDTDLLGHGYFAEAEPILQDLYKVLRDGERPQERGLIPRLKEVLTYWLLEIR